MRFARTCKNSPSARSRSSKRSSRNRPSATTVIPSLILLFSYSAKNGVDYESTSLLRKLVGICFYLYSFSSLARAHDYVYADKDEIYD